MPDKISAEKPMQVIRGQLVHITLQRIDPKTGEDIGHAERVRVYQEDDNAEILTPVFDRPGIIRDSRYDVFKVLYRIVKDT